MKDRKHVIIVGGGISGLATAYALQEEACAGGLPVTFTLLEAGAAVGGKIVTERVDDFVIEGGPDCFLRQKPWAADLCRQLGLGDALMGTNEGTRTVFVLNEGRLTPLPDGVMLIVPTRVAPFVTSRLISWRGKIRMAMELLIPPRRGDGDESVAAFVRRRLGQEALTKIAGPLLSGIHVSDPERQSLLGTFPRFRDLEIRHGSLIRGMIARRRASSLANDGAARPSSTFITLREGVGQLIQALVNALRDGAIVTDANVVRLEQVFGGFRMSTAHGESFWGDAVVLTTPTYVSAKLLAPLNPPLAERLAGIRYTSTATISLGFRRNEVAHPLAGYGFVVPRRERSRLLACTWTSSKFQHRASPQHVLIRCFVGGPSREEVVRQDDGELVSLARHELGRIMGLHASPVLARVFRWRDAHPQYDVGHLDRVRQIHALSAAQPGLVLTGGAFGGVGIPDCVRQGREAAQRVLSYLIQADDPGRHASAQPLS